MASRGPLTVPIILLFTIGAVYPLIFTMFWQTLGASVVLLIVAAWQRALPKLSVQHLKAYFVIGLFGISAPVALMAWLAPKLPTGILSMVVIVSPPITYLLALMFRLERVRALSLIGVVCGIGGILLMVVPELSLPEEGMVGWFLLALLAPASFALTNNLAALIDPPETPVVTFACGIVCAATIMLAPVMIGLGQTYVVPGPSTVADLAIMGAAGVTVTMYVTFLIIVRAAGPVFFSQFNYVVVVAGLGWGIWFFGESHSAYAWGAAALMLIGVALLIHSARQANKRPELAAGADAAD
jgi:drug/metabolite transporter (DMT)-like permease